MRLIKSAQALGFTLKEIAQLLELRTDPDRNCQEVKSLAAAKATEISNRIAALNENLRALRALIETCAGHEHSPACDCPIFDSFGEATSDLKLRRA